MDFMHIFLSFNGRLRRMHFWVGLLILWVVEVIIVMATVLPAMRGGGGGPLALIGNLLLLGVLVWPALAIQVKRWHDRDKSGWWVLIAFVPIIGFFWVLIECGILDGTPGPNRFGPSPKGVTGPAPVAT